MWFDYGKRISPRLILAIITTVFEEAVLAVIILWGLPQFDVHLPLMVLIAIMVAWAVNAVFFYLIGSRALRKKPVIGLGTMVGSKGFVLKKLAPDGVIKVNNEIWEARAASDKIDTGEEVIVVKQDGLRLVVTRKPEEKVDDF